MAKETADTETMTKEEAYHNVLKDISDQLKMLGSIDPTTDPDELQSQLKALGNISEEVLVRVGAASSDEEVAEIVSEYL